MDLRHSVLLNVVLLRLALYVATTAPTWLEARQSRKPSGEIQALARYGAAPFALTFARNARRSYLRGNAVALSRQQMPDVYALLATLRQNRDRGGSSPVSRRYRSLRRFNCVQGAPQGFHSTELKAVRAQILECSRSAQFHDRS
jgi:hypothetical protein